MPSPPSPRTWVDREIQPVANINAEVYQTVAWLLQPPMCKVYQSTSQSIPNATWTAVQFQTEATDPYNWHNTSVNNTRITPTFPGWYRGWYGLITTGATGGNYRAGAVRKNGVLAGERSRRDTKPNIANQSKSLRGIPFYIPMNGTTDYLEVIIYQDSGSSMSLPTGGNSPQEFFLRWWGPL